MKSVLLRAFLPFVLFLASYGGCSATSTVADWIIPELTTLETNLWKLELNNNQLRNEVEKSAIELATAKTELSELTRQLIELKKANEEQKQSLTKTNELLKQAETSLQESRDEYAKKIKREKRKKTAWQIMAIGAIIWGASK